VKGNAIDGLDGNAAVRAAAFSAKRLFEILVGESVHFYVIMKSVHAGERMPPTLSWQEAAK
jgi:hypothetical protein